MMGTRGFCIPKGKSKEDIKEREKVIKDFYAHWIAENPEKKVWNKNLNDFIKVKFISINETYNKAARRYESTVAGFRDQIRIKFNTVYPCLTTIESEKKPPRRGG